MVQRIRRCPTLRLQDGFVGFGFVLQVIEYLLDHHRVFDTYMDPSRFAIHRFVGDKKKAATIYPAC